MEKMTIQQALLTVFALMKQDGKTANDCFDLITGLYHSNQVSYKEMYDIMDKVFTPSQVPPYPEVKADYDKLNVEKL